MLATAKPTATSTGARNRKRLDPGGSYITICFKAIAVPPRNLTLSFVNPRAVSVCDDGHKIHYFLLTGIRPIADVARTRGNGCV